MKFFKFFCLLVVAVLCSFLKVLAGTYLVTNTNPDGPGSLRQATIDANADGQAAYINFAIPGVGPYVINMNAPLNSPMNLTNANGIFIDGGTQASSGSGTGDQKVIISTESNGTYGFRVLGIPGHIKNLKLVGFQSAISVIDNSNHFEISFNEIEITSIVYSGIGLTRVNNCDINHNTINSGHSGIVAAGGCQNISILENKLTNVDFAITVTTSPDRRTEVIIKDNELLKAVTRGIGISSNSLNSNFDKILVENNTMTTNREVLGNAGISIFGNIYECVLLNNSITNFRAGISLSAISNHKLLVQGNELLLNEYGIQYYSPGDFPSATYSFSILENFIGIDKSGNPNKNTTGIYITASTGNAEDVFINGNTIANNGYGIVISRGNKNTILNNKIYNNVRPRSIEIGDAYNANNGKTRPEIKSINGLTISGEAKPYDLVQVFYNDGVAGNALAVVGEAAADLSGIWTINIPLSSSTYNTSGGNNYIATATDQDGNTSEFSDPFLLSSCIVTTTADNGDNLSPVAGSLRAAINCANAKNDHAKVEFALPGNGPHTINILTSLPEITNPVKVTVDAFGGIGVGPEIIINAVNSNLICFKSSTPIVIKNLTIRNFARPIYVTNSNGIEVSGNNIDCPAYSSNNFMAVQIDFTNGFIINNNNIKNNGTGIACTTGKNALIQDNSLTENRGGLYVTNMEDLQVKNNIVSNNIVNGLNFTILPAAQSKNVIIEGNTIENNGNVSDGAVCRGIYVANPISGNMSNYQILKNRISGNVSNGIELGQCTNIEVRENIITSNQGDGINLSYSTLITIIGNRIGVDQNNNVLGNHGFGINLAYSSSNINIGLENSRNIIKNNGLGGISVKGEKNKIAYNTICNNNSKNAIFNNSGSGNHGKAIPVITSIVGFTISGTSETDDLIQVFYNDGVAQNAISFVSEKKAVNGQWSVTIPISSATYNTNGGNNYVATATDQFGNTSELSAPFLLSSCIATTTEDNGNNTTPIAGSLRAAINCANAKSEQGQVFFALAEEGPYYFELDVQLPNLNNPYGIILDGATQLESKAGIGDNQKIILQGTPEITGLKSEDNGSNLVGKKNQIRNLQFINFENGIHLISADNLVENIAIKNVGSGVKISGNNNTIRGNRIKECSTGIDYTGSNSIISENILGNLNGRAILISDGNVNNLIGNLIGVDEAAASITIKGVGMEFRGSCQHNLIKDNIIGNVVMNEEMMCYGIYCAPGFSSNAIMSNYIGRNRSGTSAPIAETGLMLNGRTNEGTSGIFFNLVSDNSFSGCGSTSIHLRYSDGCIIKNNFVGTDINIKQYENGRNGIALNGSQRNVIEANYVFFQQWDGVVIADDYFRLGDGNLLTKNRISSNGQSYRAINLIYGNSLGGNNAEAKPEFNTPTVEHVGDSYNLILTGHAGAFRKIELFKGSSDYQSAVDYIDYTMADALGNWRYVIMDIPHEPLYFSATATDVEVVEGHPKNNTSELNGIAFCNAPSVNTPDYSIYTFCVGRPVAMTNLSVLKINNHQPGVTYLWDINNDNTIDVSTQNAIELYRFNTEGAVPVKIIAKNGCYSSTVETGVEVVDLTIKTPQPEICKGQSLPLNVKPHGGFLGRFLWFKNNQLIPEQQASTNTITESGTYSIVFKDFSCPNNESDYNNAPTDPNGKIAFSTIEIAKGSCPEPTCGNCMSSFVPESEKDYVLSVWVKEDWTLPKQDYLNAGVKLTFYIDQFDGTSQPNNSLLPLKVVPGAPMVEGWQKLEGTFKAPANNVGVGITLLSSEEVDIYYDDLRIQRDNSSMKSFVYDKKDMKLMSELDERNFATFYEYDQEGQLIRIKKETERGIMTIQESQSNIFKTE